MTDAANLTPARASDSRRFRPSSGRSRVAAIDCGTNSLRLLVADVSPGARTVRDVVRRMDVVRLGEGVDRTGRLSEEALGRTFAVCDQFAGQIAQSHVDRVRFVATSAVRDASNRREFDAGIQSRLGVIPEVVSGDEEAALSFRGAAGSLGEQLRDQPTLVLDIGGGSTEFVLGNATTGEIASRCSVNVGCVRLTERCLRTDPVTGVELDTATQVIDAAIRAAGADVDLDRVQTLVGLAGSVTTIAAYILGLDHYDPDRTHGSVIPAERIHRAVLDLAAMTTAERLEIPTMHPGRADVIVGGALVLDRVLRRVGVESVVVSEHDLLDGVALSLAESRPAER